MKSGQDGRGCSPVTALGHGVHCRVFTSSLRVGIPSEPVALKKSTASDPPPLRITHVISGLEVGGAELTLLKLVRGMDRGRFRSRVISLTTPGALAPAMEAAGAPVRALGLRRRAPSPLALLRLVRWLREERPDVVQTWLPHADLLGGLAARMAGNLPVVWNLRSTNLRPGEVRRTTAWIQRLLAYGSGILPRRIVACSAAARSYHERLGYAAGKMVEIPNGFDTAAFRADPEARAHVRAAWGLRPDDVAACLVGRLHAQKAQGSFVRAISLLAPRYPQLRAVMIGEGLSPAQPQVADWVRASGCADRFRLLGHREDVARLLPGADLLVSAAASEGFPNVVAEAMACGLPCVVTDVGDSARIVGDTGVVVPPRDSAALAAAMAKLIDRGAGQRQELGRAARQRIEAEFSLATMIERYEQLYEGVRSDVRN
jgi:glycosyltransferase involved in cell wall biosynthesis